MSYLFYELFIIACAIISLIVGCINIALVCLPLFIKCRSEKLTYMKLLENQE